jgi:hypothetical protein
MTRRTTWCLATLLAVPGIGAAQQPAPAWRFGLGAAQTWFSAAAVSVSDTRFSPSPGITVGAEVARQFGPWQLLAGADNRPAVLRAADSATVIEVRGVPLSRAGLRLGAGRELRLGHGVQLNVTGILRGDLWSLADDEQRFRPGGEFGLALHLNAGRLRIEQRVTAGLSASPFTARDLPEGYERRMLRWVGVGIGVGL